MKNMLLFISLLFLINVMQAGQTKVVIIYTNNTNGFLENCHCPSHPYGAIEKRAVVIDSIRRVEKNVLLLDTGDILDIISNKKKHHYILKAYEYMNYDAWIAGDQDFVEGIDFFQQQFLNLKMPLVNTNMIYKNKFFAKKYIYKTFEDITIGITGVINTEFKKYIYSDAKKYIQFIKPDKVLKSAIREMSAKCNFIILLSHNGMDNDRLIAQNYSGIDLIIGSHSQTITNEPERVNNTMIVQAGENGFRTGVLSLFFNDKKVQSIKNQLRLLKEKDLDHPEIMKLIEEYKKQLKSDKQP
jgi:2',3'-cyclic-nucleotide 2'-phosphodiesterase (5'-nucleotidase family)